VSGIFSTVGYFMYRQETTDMLIREEVLGELLSGYEKPEDLLGEAHETRNLHTWHVLTVS
jgi:hypothetical protein